MNRPTAWGALLALLSALPATAELRDGHLFDQGVAMTAPAEGASQATARALFWRGQWDVAYTQYEGGEATHTGEARAATHLMNRGHGYLERFVCDDFDGQGNARNTVMFLTHVPSRDEWNLGVADSWRESIRLYSGNFDGDELVLETILRVGGSGGLTHFRVRLEADGDDAFTMTGESGPYGGAFAREWTRRYTRRAEDPNFLAGSGVGTAAPGLPEEAGQFDFLLGEWNEQHQMTFPNGQQAQWPANGTAVRALNGHAILEHGWFDVDPNLPDAATTILRIYNRTMRRWESMYTTNRFNSVLYFGGVQEGDRIVLHSFESDLTTGPYSYWTFHDMGPDGFGWFANTSRDRGETFSKTWIINATRKPSS